jgi:hypothetical protein
MHYSRVSRETAAIDKKQDFDPVFAVFVIYKPLFYW